MTIPDPRQDTPVGRLFVAVPLSPASRAALTTYARDANRGRPLPGRTVPPDNWHLTLRFLGDTPAAAYERLVQALGAVATGGAIEFTFNGLGAFPRPDRARVLWVGIDEGRDRLVRLGEAVEQCARSAGFPAEARPFSPHLTLSRLDPPTDLSHLVTVSAASVIRERADHFALYRSHLGHGPARYETLRSFRLR
jgi:RNA 2',3'-cyclic 3'-phosphodiesterase